MNDPIRTANICPLMHSRDYDWTATRDSYTSGDPQGFGPTREAAIANLLEQEADRASRQGTTPMNQTENLIADLVLILQAHSIRHFSIFTDGGEPRIYLSGKPYGGCEAYGHTFAEALHALDQARIERETLETLY